MGDLWRDGAASQLGAAIDMLENAIVACPDHVWDDGVPPPAFWYNAFHALFYLDLYLFDAVDGFAPPEPFGLEELDPAGVLPPRPYSKDEILTYVEYCRRRANAVFEAMTEETAARRSGIEWLDMSFLAAQLYNMRHVQHHAAQLNLILRAKTDSAPRWVRSAGDGPA